MDESSNPKGFAYVQFKNPEEALKACVTIDGSSFQGRIIHVLPAADRNLKPSEEKSLKRGDEYREGRIKDAREKMKKANSGKEFNWAVLYMNVRHYHNAGLIGVAHPYLYDYFLILERWCCQLDRDPSWNTKSHHLESPKRRIGSCSTRPSGNPYNIRDKKVL